MKGLDALGRTDAYVASHARFRAEHSTMRSVAPREADGGCHIVTVPLITPVFLHPRDKKSILHPCTRSGKKPECTQRKKWCGRACGHTIDEEDESGLLG